MKLNANRYALAAAISFAVLWLLCTLLVALLPSQAMHVPGAMLHGDMMNLQWNMHWSGLLIGWVAWTITAGLTAWMTATIDNRLISWGRNEQEQ